MIATGDSNYEYVTARVSARRARLFEEEDYRKLIRMSPGEIARFMEETEYDREINALGSRHSGVDLIEFALNRNLAHHFEDILRWADGQLYEMIARYLEKFDAWNVKTTLRGIYADTDPEAIREDFISAGTFDDAMLEALVAAGSMEEVVTVLEGTMFGEPLDAAFSDYEDSGLLVPLENAVDRAYYENLLGAAPEDEGPATELYVQFLQAEIDFRNVRNALRIARSGADISAADYFIAGGRLFDAQELDQLASNVDELINRVRESTYGNELADALDELERADSLIEFERALDVALLGYSDHLSHLYPLSVCPVLAYVLAKEREVENIRAIARGRESGLDQTEIEEELVIL
ncbi:MAG: V-type ATP synthase subunit C [Halobacteriales archaeon]|nr:V-type ATP synthase subunit C [Halobacteriales archaeon]